MRRARTRRARFHPSRSRTGPRRGPRITLDAVPCPPTLARGNTDGRRGWGEEEEEDEKEDEDEDDVKWTEAGDCESDGG